MSDELIVRWCWNGPNISQCDSIVMQALNFHFESGPWHLTSGVEQSQTHQVSMVVDQINHMKSALTFMV